MTTVRINTSDLDWLQRHGHGLDGPIPYGTDVKGVMYFTGPVQVASVEHVKFAGASMIRFDLGPDAPRDHNRHALYPDTYLVEEES